MLTLLNTFIPKINTFKTKQHRNLVAIPQFATALTCKMLMSFVHIHGVCISFFVPSELPSNDIRIYLIHHIEIHGTRLN